MVSGNFTLNFWFTHLVVEIGRRILFYQSIEWNHGHPVNHIGVPPDVFPASSLRGTSMIRLYCLPKTMNQNPVTLIKINGLRGVCIT